MRDLVVFDMSNFKVVYSDKVYRVVNASIVEAKEPKDGDNYVKPSRVIVTVLNEDGNLLIIDDEAWMFQFIPVLK